MNQVFSQTSGIDSSLREALTIRVLRQGLEMGQWFFRELLWPSLAGIGLLLLLANQAHATNRVMAATVGPEVGPLAGLRAGWVAGCMTHDSASSIRSLQIFAVADLSRGPTNALQALVQITEEMQPIGSRSADHRIEAQQVLEDRDGLELVIEGRNIPRQNLRIPRSANQLVQITNAQSSPIGFECRIARN